MATSPVFATPTSSPHRAHLKAMGNGPIVNLVSSRRARCISCSESGQYANLELSLDPEDEEEFLERYMAKKNRSDSLVGRIVDDIKFGTVKYFCRSRGHGFLNPDENASHDLFMHISDIEGDYVPKRGDRVSYRPCPLPPKFNKFQAVHVHILKCSPQTHRKWESPETPEEIEEDKHIQSMPFDI
eukprot:maker-scaffold211_size255937-snap-gene-1.14 protein:Tk07168 transcript:maker-scaffold211_size255937-snap-gene-1.14-mRNA-1 annotation:"cold shock domain-containing protein c2"